MKYISTYKLFESEFSKFTGTNHEYSIYDWFEDLKTIQWSKSPIRHNKSGLNESSLKFWSDHFIGNGWYENIKEYADSIYKSLQKIDTDFISDKMLEVWDNLPQEKEKRVTPVVAYGDYKDINSEDNVKWSGSIYTKDSTSIIIHILIGIIYPTLYIGYPSVPLRQTKDQMFVTDVKWQCQNFDINNYSIKEGDQIHNGGNYTQASRRRTNIYGSDIKKFDNYSVKNVISLYKPCLLIGVGDLENSNTGTFSLDKIESLYDDILEEILPTLDYDVVIWDKYRGSRKFDTDDFSDYTLKIILK